MSIVATICSIPLFKQKYFCYLIYPVMAPIKMAFEIYMILFCLSSAGTDLCHKHLA